MIISRRFCSLVSKSLCVTKLLPFAIPQSPDDFIPAIPTRFARGSHHLSSPDSRAKACSRPRLHRSSRGLHVFRPRGRRRICRLGDSRSSALCCAPTTPAWAGPGHHERRRVGNAARQRPHRQRFAAALKQRCPLLHEDSAAHRSEHAVEVELPFLQMRQPQTQVRSHRAGHGTVRHRSSSSETRLLM